MKNTDWKAIAELIGIAAIVASLLFVGMQMKQSQARTAMAIDTLISTTENPNFISAVAKGRSGRRAELTLEEQVTMSQYATAVLMAYDDQYFQYLNGFVTEERWQASKAALKNFLREEANMPVRLVFERLPGRFSVSFQKVVNELTTEIDKSKTAI